MAKLICSVKFHRNKGRLSKKDYHIDELANLQYTFLQNVDPIHIKTYNYSHFFQVCYKSKILNN